MTGGGQGLHKHPDRHRVVSGPVRAATHVRSLW